MRDAAFMDKVVQGPRNVIEQATNWNALLYYNFFVDKAFPDLPEAKKRDMIVNFSRSFTGDYSPYANLMAFEKAGVAGHFMSNFAKWKFNRTSRYIADLSMMSRANEYGMKAMLPFIYSLGMGAIMAGVQGTVGFVEYEAARQFGLKTGWWDWKPLAAILREAGVKSTLIERGAVTAFSDWMAGKFGEESGPDISGSIRESSILQAPTVAVSTAWDLLSTAATVAKRGLSQKEAQEYIDSMEKGIFKDMAEWVSETHGRGLSSDDEKSFVKALPSNMQEAYRARFVKELTFDDGTKRYLVPEANKDEGKYVRTPFQQALAEGVPLGRIGNVLPGMGILGGTHTTAENRFEDAKAYHTWLEKKGSKEFTALKDGLMNHLDDPWLVNRNAKLILEKHGQDALERVLQDIVKRDTEKMQTDYFGLKMLAAEKNRDTTAAIRAIERILKAKNVESPRTSEDR